MRLPRWMKADTGVRKGDAVEFTITAPWCPCGGRCHFDRSPCSFDCLAHDERPSTGGPSDG